MTFQTILQNSDCLEKGKLYKFFEPVFGKGLLTASGKVSLTKQNLIIFNYLKNLINN